MIVRMVTHNVTIWARKSIIIWTKVCYCMKGNCVTTWTIKPHTPLEKHEKKTPKFKQWKTVVSRTQGIE